MRQSAHVPNMVRSSHVLMVGPEPAVTAVNQTLSASRRPIIHTYFPGKNDGHNGAVHDSNCAGVSGLAKEGQHPPVVDDPGKEATSPAPDCACSARTQAREERPGEKETGCR